jgi:hypothetical protein
MSQNQQDLFKTGKTNWFHVFQSIIESGDLAAMSKECSAVASVLLVIKSYVNYREGVSFPSTRLISEKSGYSRVSITKALKVLTNYGYLKTEVSGRKNIYTVVEKFQLEHTETGSQVEVKANYIPALVSKMREELQAFIRDGVSAENHININITIPTQIVSGGVGNQVVVGDLGFDIDKTGKAAGKLQAAVKEAASEIRSGKPALPSE